MRPDHPDLMSSILLQYSHVIMRPIGKRHRGAINSCYLSQIDTHLIKTHTYMNLILLHEDDDFAVSFNMARLRSHRAEPWRQRLPQLQMSPP